MEHVSEIFGPRNDLADSVSQHKFTNIANRIYGGRSQIQRDSRHLLNSGKKQSVSVYISNNVALFALAKERIHNRWTICSIFKIRNGANSGLNIVEIIFAQLSDISAGIDVLIKTLDQIQRFAIVRGRLPGCRIDQRLLRSIRILNSVILQNRAACNWIE